MTSYRDALKRSAFGLLTGWVAVGFFMGQIWDDLKEIASGVVSLAVSLAGLVLVLLAPVLIIFAPLVALLVRLEERSYARAVAKAEREIDEHYGGWHQRKAP